MTFPRGREYTQPSDKMRRSVSQLITTPTEVRALIKPERVCLEGV
jgi:hypothetical protein